MTIDVLTFLYLVIAIGLIPIFTLVSMILWRVYKNMDRIDAILVSLEQGVHFAKNIDKVPGLVANKLMSSVNRFFGN